MLLIISRNEDRPELESKILAAAFRQSVERGDIDGSRLAHRELVTLLAKRATAGSLAFAPGDHAVDRVFASDNVTEMDLDGISKAATVSQQLATSDLPSKNENGKSGSESSSTHGVDSTAKHGNLNFGDVKSRGNGGQINETVNRLVDLANSRKNRVESPPAVEPPAQPQGPPELLSNNYGAEHLSGTLDFGTSSSFTQEPKPATETFQPQDAQSEIIGREPPQNELFDPSAKNLADVDSFSAEPETSDWILELARPAEPVIEPHNATNEPVAEFPFEQSAESVSEHFNVPDPKSALDLLSPEVKTALSTGGTEAPSAGSLPEPIGGIVSPTELITESTGIANSTAESTADPVPEPVAEVGTVGEPIAELTAESIAVPNVESPEPGAVADPIAELNAESISVPNVESTAEPGAVADPIAELNAESAADPIADWAAESGVVADPIAELNVESGAVADPIAEWAEPGAVGDPITGLNAESGAHADPISEVAAEQGAVVEPVAELDAEQGAIVEPIAELDAQSRSVVDPNVELAAESGSVVEPIAELDAESGAVVDPIGELDAESGAVVKPIAELDAESGSVAEPIAELDAESGAVVEPIAEFDAESGAVVDPIGELAAESGAVLEPIAELAAEPGAIIEPIAELDAESGAVVEPISELDAESGAIADPIAELSVESGAVGEPIARLTAEPDGFPDLNTAASPAEHSGLEKRDDETFAEPESTVEFPAEQVGIADQIPAANLAQGEVIVSNSLAGSTDPSESLTNEQAEVADPIVAWTAEGVEDQNTQFAAEQQRVADPIAELAADPVVIADQAKYSDSAAELSAEPFTEQIVETTDEPTQVTASSSDLTELEESSSSGTDPITSGSETSDSVVEPATLESVTEEPSDSDAFIWEPPQATPAEGDQELAGESPLELNMDSAELQEATSNSSETADALDLSLFEPVQSTVANDTPRTIEAASDASETSGSNDAEFQQWAGIAPDVVPEVTPPPVYPNVDFSDANSEDVSSDGELQAGDVDLSAAAAVSVESVESSEPTVPIDVNSPEYSTPAQYLDFSVDETEATETTQVGEAAETTPVAEISEEVPIERSADSAASIYAQIDFEPDMPAEAPSSDTMSLASLLAQRPIPDPDSDFIYNWIGGESTDPFFVLHLCYFRSVRQILQRQQIKESALGVHDYKRVLRNMGIAYNILMDPGIRVDYDLRQLGLREPSWGHGLAIPEDAKLPEAGGKVRIALHELLILCRIFDSNQMLAIVNASRMLSEDRFWGYLAESGLLTQVELDSIRSGYKLITNGLVSVTQFEQAFHFARAHQQQILEILLQAGWIRIEDLQQFANAPDEEELPEAPKFVETKILPIQKATAEINVAASMPSWMDWGDSAEPAPEQISFPNAADPSLPAASSAPANNNGEQLAAGFQNNLDYSKLATAANAQLGAEASEYEPPELVDFQTAIDYANQQESAGAPDSSSGSHEAELSSMDETSIADRSGSVDLDKADPASTDDPTLESETNSDVVAAPEAEKESSGEMAETFDVADALAKTLKSSMETGVMSATSPTTEDADEDNGENEPSLVGQKLRMKEVEFIIEPLEKSVQELMADIDRSIAEVESAMKLKDESELESEEKTDKE